MTRYGRSRSPVKVTMARTDTEAAGSPAPKLGDYRETDWSFWSVRAKVRHLFRIHTFIDEEVWSPVVGPDGIEEMFVSFNGQICWLCPARR